MTPHWCSDGNPRPQPTAYARGGVNIDPYRLGRKDMDASVRRWRGKAARFLEAGTDAYTPSNAAVTAVVSPYSRWRTIAPSRSVKTCTHSLS